MLNVTIIDDEPKMTELLSNYFDMYARETGNEFHVSVFNTGADIFKKREYADIVLLDIDMPVMGGMEIAKNIRATDSECVIVFITNMTQYAIRGYEVDALDFIVKPVTYATFKLRMQRAVKVAMRNRRDETLLTLHYDKVKVKISDIIYIESVRHKLLYHTFEKEYEEWNTMASAVQRFEPFGFALCNSGYMVNLKHIESISGDEAVLVGGRRLQISRQKKKQLLQALSAYVK